jgi:hypothetical protein
MAKIADMITHPPSFVVLRLHGLGDYLSVYERPFAHTEWFDALAYQGLRFTYYHPGHDEDDLLRQTVFPRLQDAGYECFHIAAPERDCVGLIHDTVEILCDKAALTKPLYLLIDIPDLASQVLPTTVGDSDLASLLNLPPGCPDTPAERRRIAAWLGLLQEIDGDVAQLFEELEERGIEDDTLVVVMGYGPPVLPAFADGRAALILRWSSVLPGSVVIDRLVTLPDVAATLLDLAGLPHALPESVSLLPLLDES